MIDREGEGSEYAARGCDCSSNCSDLSNLLVDLAPPTPTNPDSSLLTHSTPPPPPQQPQAKETIITQDRIFEAVEKLQVEKANRGVIVRTDLIDEDVVPPLIRRQVAVYTAAKALIGAITPYYDEVSKITCCPGNAPTGQVFFVPLEEALDQTVLTR